MNQRKDMLVSSDVNTERHKFMKRISVPHNDSLEKTKVLKEIAWQLSRIADVYEFKCGPTE